MQPAISLGKINLALQSSSLSQQENKGMLQGNTCSTDTTSLVGLIVRDVPFPQRQCSNSTGVWRAEDVEEALEGFLT